MSSTMQVFGLASGLDTEDIISKLMALERVPIARLEERQNDYKTLKNAWMDVNTKLLNLLTKVRGLESMDYEARKATSSAEDYLTATVQSGVPPAEYSIVVENLAKSHSVISSKVGDSTQALGYSGSFSLNGTRVKVSATDSLADIRDAVNSAGAGVTAVIVDNQLLLRSDATGTAGEMSLSDWAVAVDDTDVLTATVDPSASTGTSSVTVTELARAHQIATDWLAADYSVSQDGSSFTIDIDGNQYLVSVDAGATLSDIKEAIGATGAPVEVTVAEESGSSRLVLESQQTGTAFQISIIDGASGLAAELGLIDGGTGLVKNEIQAAADAKLTVDGLEYTRSSNEINDIITGVTLSLKSTGTTNLTVTHDSVLASLGILDSNDTLIGELTPATDAVFYVEGLKVTRSDNVVDDVIDGITITLKKATADPVTLKVDYSPDAVVSRVKEFVSQYNSAISLIGDQMDRDTIGTLAGDYTLIRIQGNLRRYVTEQVGSSAGSLFSNLAEIGIKTTDESGILTVDETALKEALSTDPDAVKALFEAEDGLIAKLESELDFLTKSTTGLIPGRAKSIDNIIEDFDKQIENMERRLEIRERNLVAQFTQLETILSSLQNQGAWLTQQINSLNSFWYQRK